MADNSSSGAGHTTHGDDAPDHAALAHLGIPYADFTQWEVGQRNAPSPRAEVKGAKAATAEAATAETSKKWRSVCRLRIDAIVVLPVPGGPQSSNDMGWSPSMRRRNGEPAVRR